MMARTVSHCLPLTPHITLVHASVHCGMNESLTSEPELTTFPLFCSLGTDTCLPVWSAVPGVQELAATAQGSLGTTESPDGVKT